VNWSLYITIFCGFSMMLIALLYFEWRTLFRCFGRCKDKICGKSASRTVGVFDDPNNDANKLSESENDGSVDELDMHFNYNLERLA